MSWQIMVIELVKSLGLGAILGAIVALVVQNRLARRNASHLRVEERRCEVLSSVYAALVEMEVAIQAWSTPDAAGDEALRRANVFRETANKFRAEFQHNRFWFDEQTGILLHRIWDGYKSAGYALEDAQANIDYAENRSKARAFVQKHIPELRSSLEREIRRIIRGQSG